MNLSSRIHTFHIIKWTVFCEFIVLCLYLLKLALRDGAYLDELIIVILVPVFLCRLTQFCIFTHTLKNHAPYFPIWFLFTTLPMLFVNILLVTDTIDLSGDDKVGMLWPFLFTIFYGIQFIVATMLFLLPKIYGYIKK